MCNYTSREFNNLFHLHTTVPIQMYQPSTSTYYNSSHFYYISLYYVCYLLEFRNIEVIFILGKEKYEIRWNCSIFLWSGYINCQVKALTGGFDVIFMSVTRFQVENGFCVELEGERGTNFS